MANINGTSGDDSLTGTPDADSIAGKGGQDTINSGSGNDTITAGSGNDSINAGEGDNSVDVSGGFNTISSGSGADYVETGSGDDQINAGEGDNYVKSTRGFNTISSGSGADYVETGSGDDEINAGDGINTINAGSGSNTVTTGAGDDSINSGTRDDQIMSGGGNDTINAGRGQNTIQAGSGDDQITTGSGDDYIDGEGGDDIISTGSGNDQVVFQNNYGNDTITDFDDGNDNIVIYADNISTFSDVSSRLTQSGADALLTLDDGSTLTFSNTDMNDLSSSNFQIQSAPVCFAMGAMIMTPRGEIAVEHLKVGDQVITKDAGPVPIIWIGRQDLNFTKAVHRHKPIEIRESSLGAGRPNTDLIVSPHHRILLSNTNVLARHGESEVFLPAKALSDLPHVRLQIERRRVTYFSILLERHHVIWAGGIEVESFYPGKAAFEMLTGQHRLELCKLYPGLERDVKAAYGTLARTSLTVKEARAIIKI